MHVNSNKDPVEIRGRDIVLSVGGFFLKETHPCRRNYLLQVCAVIFEPSEPCEVGIHTSGSTRPLEKLCKEIGGLEGRGEGCESL